MRRNMSWRIDQTNRSLLSLLLSPNSFYMFVVYLHWLRYWRNVWPRFLNRILKHDKTSLRPTHSAVDHHDALLPVSLHNLEVLHRVSLPSHISRHLLSRIHSAPASLTLSRRSHASVRQTCAVASILSMHSPPLH